MGFLKDNAAFEVFNLKDMGKKIKKNPLSVLTGMDEFSNSFWNKIRGQDNEAIVNKWGGPTAGTYARAENQGIDTGAAHQMHGAAQTIAGIYAGNGLMNIGGSGGAATSNGIPVGNQMDHAWQEGGGGGMKIPGMQGGMPQLPGMGGGGMSPDEERRKRNREMLMMQNQIDSLRVNA